MGAEDDATSLKNMLYALGFIEKSNELRRANNLEEFKISARAMAAAQYQANASLHTEDHTFQFGYGENLAWEWMIRKSPIWHGMTVKKTALF